MGLIYFKGKSGVIFSQAKQLMRYCPGPTERAVYGRKRIQNAVFTVFRRILFTVIGLRSTNV